MKRDYQRDWNIRKDNHTIDLLTLVRRLWKSRWTFRQKRPTKDAVIYEKRPTNETYWHDTRPTTRVYMVDSKVKSRRSTSLFSQPRYTIDYITDYQADFGDILFLGKRVDTYIYICISSTADFCPRTATAWLIGQTPQSMENDYRPDIPIEIVFLGEHIYLII